MPIIHMTKKINGATTTTIAVVIFVNEKYGRESKSMLFVIFKQNLIRKWYLQWLKNI